MEPRQRYSRASSNQRRPPRSSDSPRRRSTATASKRSDADRRRRERDLHTSIAMKRLESARSDSGGAPLMDTGKLLFVYASQSTDLSTLKWW